MIYLFCILIGIALGQAYRANRTREVKRALEASESLRQITCDVNRRLYGDLLVCKRRLANIKAFACRTHVDRIQSLGGAALLPVPADRVGQHSTIERSPLRGL